MPRNPRPRWKRWIRTATLTILIVVGIPAGVHFYLRWSADRAFQKALEEADRRMALSESWTSRKECLRGGPIPRLPT